jgi:hypothetical protein
MEQPIPRPDAINKLRFAANGAFAMGADDRTLSNGITADDEK